jgi:hypothetical protein
VRYARQVTVYDPIMPSLCRPPVFQPQEVTHSNTRDTVQSRDASSNDSCVFSNVIVFNTIPFVVVAVPGFEVFDELFKSQRGLPGAVAIWLFLIRFCSFAITPLCSCN